MGDYFNITPSDESALGETFDEESILSQIPQGETVFLVGHAPTLGNMVNHLVGKIVLQEGLKKSMAAVIEFSDEIAFGTGELIHEVRPD